MKTSLPLARVTGALALVALPFTPGFAGTYTNDFESGDTTGLTIHAVSGDPPEVIATDGNPGGYLKLTDSIGSTTSTVVFPDFEPGTAVKAFVFEIDCRIGDGTDTPADGFSINFARPNDPAIVDGTGYTAGAAEEGTVTGLAIGFDCYTNSDTDPIAITIRLDGELLDEIEMPTLYGEVDDPTSLQTGPIGAAGWAPLRVELKDNGALDVVWKGEKIVDNLATGYTPSPGRVVFGARTGGASQLHHFDNLSLTTTPSDLAFVTTAGFARVDDSGTMRYAYVARISDFETSSVVSPSGVTAVSVDGTTVPTADVTVTKDGSVTTVSYIPPADPEAGSLHEFAVTFADGNSNAQTAIRTVTGPQLPAAALLATAPVAEAWNIREVTGDGVTIDSLAAALDTLAVATPALTTDGTAVAVNFADPNAGSVAGVISAYQPFLSDTDADDNDFVQVGNLQLTVAEAGDYTFWVQSDDGFALRLDGAEFLRKTGPGIIDPGDPSVLVHAGVSGNTNTQGVATLAAGTYTLEYLFFERGGGASMEIAWSKGDIVENPAQAAWTLPRGTSAEPIVPATLPETPPASATAHWGMREIRDAAAERSLAAAIETAAGDVSGFTVTDLSQPVVNHNDLDGGIGSIGFDLGIFNNDLPFIGNLDGGDDDLIVLAKTTVALEAGFHTFGAIVDDGFAIVVRGPDGSFTASGGPGSIDVASSDTIYNAGYSNQPTLGVYNVRAAGDYEVFFIAQEGAGGAGWEVFHAPGAFTTIGGTADWQLLGTPSDPSVPAVTPLLPATLPGVPSINGAWGLRMIRDGGDMNSIYIALAAATGDFTFTDGTEEYLNFANVNDLDEPTLAGLFRSDGVDAYLVDDVGDYPGGAGTEDHVAAVAKARIVIPTAGEWTFGIHSDDGFAFRIPGAQFVRVSGAGAHIDPASKDTAIFRYGTGDSNARIVTTLAAGEYNVDFLWFEGGGGSHFEVYAAPGAFANDADTGEWRLIGGPEGLEIVAWSDVEPPVTDSFLITDVTYNAATSDLGITFESEAGINYTVQWTTDPAGTWQDGGSVPGTAGSTTTTLNAPTLSGGTAPDRFFVRVVKP